MYKKLREPINSITHLSGAVFSFIALFAMLAKAFVTNASNISIASVTIFGISLILLYTVSGTYHGIISSDKIINFLQKSIAIKKEEVVLFFLVFNISLLLLIC